jgi:hypothetical protein
MPGIVAPPTGGGSDRGHTYVDSAGNVVCEGLLAIMLDAWGSAEHAMAKHITPPFLPDSVHRDR